MVTHEVGAAERAGRVLAATVLVLGPTALLGADTARAAERAEPTVAGAPEFATEADLLAAPAAEQPTSRDTRDIGPADLPDLMVGTERAMIIPPGAVEVALQIAPYALSVLGAGAGALLGRRHRISKYEEQRAAEEAEYEANRLARQEREANAFNKEVQAAAEPLWALMQAHHVDDDVGTTQALYSSLTELSRRAEAGESPYTLREELKKATENVEAYLKQVAEDAEAMPDNRAEADRLLELAESLQTTLGESGWNLDIKSSRIAKLKQTLETAKAKQDGTWVNPDLDPDGEKPKVRFVLEPARVYRETVETLTVMTAKLSHVATNGNQVHDELVMNQTNFDTLEGRIATALEELAALRKAYHAADSKNVKAPEELDKTTAGLREQLAEMQQIRERKSPSDIETAEQLDASFDATVDSLTAWCDSVTAKTTELADLKTTLEADRDRLSSILTDLQEYALEHVDSLTEKSYVTANTNAAIIVTLVRQLKLSKPNLTAIQKKMALLDEYVADAQTIMQHEVEETPDLTNATVRFHAEMKQRLQLIRQAAKPTYGSYTEVREYEVDAVKLPQHDPKAKLTRRQADKLREQTTTARKAMDELERRLKIRVELPPDSGTAWLDNREALLEELE